MQSFVLVADCGSTKCDWRVLSKEGGVEATHTPGFNPSYMNPEAFLHELLANSVLVNCKYQVSEIHFYGSGCGSASGQLIVSNLLKQIFVNAKISVYSDMLAAARACFKGEPVIAAILGTGSNSCRFDGEQMSHCAPSLGYILGDEGSGNQIGQQLLRDYFYKTMPDTLWQKFHRQFNPEIDELIDRVYRQPRPNTYLASFAAFAVENKDDAFIKNLVAAEFQRFLQVFVMGFADYKNLKTGFVGSIAWHFRDVLRETCQSLNIEVGLILQKPIDELTEFHQSAL
jgi:N-acetylglucosamine kinase-like BadF-type ATPase